MSEEKNRRLEKARKKMHQTARIKDAAQLKGRVKVVTSAAILKLITDIVESHSEESNKELLTKITEAEFELLKLKKNSETLHADLKRVHEESFAKDTTISELTDKLAEILDIAERREKEVRALSEMLKTSKNDHSVKVTRLESKIEKLKSTSGESADTEEIDQLKEELSTLQSELRMSEDIEEMQRSEIAQLEEQLEKTRSENESHIETLGRKINKLERDLTTSRDLEKKLHRQISGMTKSKTRPVERLEDFGSITMRLGYCTPEQLEEATKIKKSISEMGLKPLKLGEILVDKGYLTDSQHTEIMRLQGSASPKLEGYEFISKLGEGLLGLTYKARQVSLDREVAVKIIRKEFSANKKYVAGFLEQAKQAGRLHHKNIAHVIDAGEADGTYFCILEHVRGQNLRDVLRKKRKLTERQVLHAGLEAAHALAEATKIGMVHGDIKPSNIIINAEGVVKVCDFGLGMRINLETEFALPYALFEAAYFTSPEIVRGGKPDIRSDIYSLGATLFRLSTGCYPFGQSPTPKEALLAHLDSNPSDIHKKNPEVSPEFGHMVARMLEQAPEDRYQSAEEVIAAIINLIKRHKSGTSKRSAPKRRQTRRLHK